MFLESYCSLLQLAQEQPSNFVQSDDDDVQVEYVTESINPFDPNYRAFAKIFEAFKVQYNVQ